MVNSRMKCLGYLSVLFLVLGVSSICLVCSAKDAADLTWRGNNALAAKTINRKLKEISNGDGSETYVDDYGPMDPVPSSKASIRPGPIQHGTPLMPYIPNPSPPPTPSADSGIIP